MNVNLNILPLGSYDILIGMDRLEPHHVIHDCLHKLILCTNSQGIQVKIQGIPKKFYEGKYLLYKQRSALGKGENCM